MNYAPIGSISHGTLREQDLLHAFASALNQCLDINNHSNATHEQLCREAWDHSAIMDCPAPGADQGRWQEQAQELITQLEDALCEYAPPFCYFGAHEGDGSDFGFWPSDEMIEDAIVEQALLKVGDLSEIPEGYTGYVLVVNDHGNMEFYEAVISYRPLFSVV